MRVLIFPELKSEKGIPWSRVEIWRKEKAGKFPKRIKLGDRAIAWIESEIDGWLAERAAERDTDDSDDDNRAREGVPPA